MIFDISYETLRKRRYQSFLVLFNFTWFFLLFAKYFVQYCSFWYLKGSYINLLLNQSDFQRTSHMLFIWPYQSFSQSWQISLDFEESLKNVLTEVETQWPLSLYFLWRTHIKTSFYWINVLWPLSAFWTGMLLLFFNFISI